MAPADGSRDFELLCEWGDVKTADHICDFLQEPEDGPFLAVANFVNPHNICEWARGQEPGEGPLGQEPHPTDLPTLPANHAVDAFEPSIITSVQRHSDRVLVGRDFSPQQWRRYLWAYYRMTELVDAQILRILRAFDEAGLADNTVLVFMSDHGDGCGSHRWNQKMVFYEEVIRVPFIVVGPGLQAGALNDRLVSTGEDLFPTCCEAAGIEPPNDRRGHSLLGACRGEESAHRHDSLFVESSLVDEFNKTADIMRRNAGRCVVTERWKYSVWSWGEHREHLVDLWSDPGEMVNLAVSSRYGERLQEMRSVLRYWVAETGDRFVVPETKP